MKLENVDYAKTESVGIGMTTMVILWGGRKARLEKPIMTFQKKLFYCHV